MCACKWIFPNQKLIRSRCIASSQDVQVTISIYVTQGDSIGICAGARLHGLDDLSHTHYVAPLQTTSRSTREQAD